MATTITNSNFTIDEVEYTISGEQVKWTEDET